MSAILQQLGRVLILSVLALALSQSVVTAAGLRIGGGMKSIGGSKMPSLRGGSASPIFSSPSRNSHFQPATNRSSYPAFNNSPSKSIAASNNSKNLNSSSRLGSELAPRLTGGGLATKSNFIQSNSITKPSSNGSAPSTIGRLNSGSLNNGSGNDKNRIPRNQEQQIPRNEQDRIPRNLPTERPARPAPELPELADSGRPGRSIPRGPSIRNPPPSSVDSPSTGLPANPSPDASPSDGLPVNPSPDEPPSNRLPANPSPDEPPSNRVPVNPPSNRLPVDPPATVYPRDPLPINPPGGETRPFPGIDLSVGIGPGAYSRPIATEPPLGHGAITETADALPPEVPAETANKFAGVDLILEDVRAQDSTTLVAGPSYRVKFRNQGFQTSGKFRVKLQAALDGIPSNSYVTLEMPGLAGGQAYEAILRMPLTSMNLTTGKLATDLANAPRPFSDLIVVIDADKSVSETDEANNSATIPRAALER